MAPSLVEQRSLDKKIFEKFWTKIVWLFTPGSCEDEVVSRYHHQSHLYDLPDSEDDPHGGPAEDVAHVHDDDDDQLVSGHDTINIVDLELKQ